MKKFFLRMVSMLLCLALLTAVLPGAFAAEEETAAEALSEEEIADLEQLTDKAGSSGALYSAPVSPCEALPATRGIGNVNECSFNYNAMDQSSVVGRTMKVEYILHSEDGADNPIVEFSLFRGSSYDDDNSNITRENLITSGTLDASDYPGPGDWNMYISIDTAVLNLPAGDYTLTLATQDRNGNIAGDSYWKITIHLFDHEVPLERLYFYDIDWDSYIAEDMVLSVGSSTSFWIDFDPFYTTADRHTEVSSLDPSIVTAVNIGGEITVRGISNGTAYIVVKVGDQEFYQKVIVGTGSSVDDGQCHGGVNCPSLRFNDILSGDWYHPDVDFVVSRHLMGGTGECTFEPESPMTRSMLVTVLWRYEGEPAEGSNIFTAVQGGQWYTDAIAWAALNKIVGGMGGGLFVPEGKITREQMAAILYRYAERKGYNVSARANLSGFPDAGDVSDWAEDAMQWAVANGFIGGSEGRLIPGGNAIRAQVAAILHRFITSIESGRLNK